MPINEKDMFERLETALKVYYQTTNVPVGGQIQIDLFIKWLYNQYGFVRKGTNNEKVDNV